MQIKKLLWAACVTAGMASASSIVGVSASDGVINKSYDDVTDLMTGGNLNGSQVIAQLANGGTLSCTFIGNSCSGAAGAVVVNADTLASDTIWSIANSTGQSLASITIQLSGAAFNPCVGGNQPVLTISTCFSPTPGAGQARSVIGNSPNTGTTQTSATVNYTNRIQLSTSPTVSSDLFTQIQLLFGVNGSPAFQNGETFTFLADTDLVHNPEPATYGLVGSALLALGLFRRRR